MKVSGFVAKLSYRDLQKSQKKNKHFLALIQHNFTSRNPKSHQNLPYDFFKITILEEGAVLFLRIKTNGYTKIWKSLDTELKIHRNAQRYNK